jgi:simple sugar transport system ATP-binding protein
VNDGVVFALDDIWKRFGATRALSGASLRVRSGAVHALLGENGAGKTTLMRIAFGLIRPDAGSIRIENRVVRLSKPRDAIRHGVGMVHQHFTIVPAMTVAENVALGGRGRFDPRAAAIRARELAAEVGLSLDPDTPAGSLSVAAQQQLEIVKALARGARILILDEPTASLPPAEASELLARLRALASTGLAVLLITHKLREALATADDVTVLRRGRVVLTAPVGGLDDVTLTREMLGTDRSAVGDSSTDSSGRPLAAPPAVRAERIGVADDRGMLRVHDATLDIHPGEIVGIAGVEGAGVRELLRGLAGFLPVTTGRIERPARIGFVPEDRHREAIAPALSVLENVALRGAGRRRGLTPWRALRDRTERLINDFEIRIPGANVPVGTLSGGNQQRLVIARELDERPDLLIAENPTRGLDVRAAAAVHARLRSARADGVAIVLYSSDLDELILLADRTFAMYAGTLRETANNHRAIGEAMLGALPITA